GVLQHALQPSDARGKPNNLIMVTSAKPGEGKTFTAINLAISIALERDFTVLLIDADFSRPNILQVLGLEAKKGLIDVLENPAVDLSDVLIRTNIDKLTVLPAGGAHDLSTELLASLRMRDIVQDIARRYRDRIVIFDSPPVLVTSEACVLATHVGQVVFVVEADKTPKSAVREALDLLDAGTRVGLVLNRCRPRLDQAKSGYYDKR
ncbi:MAG: XrtA-associated tyrosine autokinase, partial [Kiloniellaceae bacterium]